MTTLLNHAVQWTREKGQQKNNRKTDLSVDSRFQVQLEEDEISTQDIRSEN